MFIYPKNSLKSNLLDTKEWGDVRIILYIFYIMIPILHFMRVDYTLYTFIRSTLYVLLSIYLSITLRTILSTYVSLHLYLIYIISSQ